MEIIVDCAKCGSSELKTRSDWTQEDDIYVYVGECVGCQILTRAELIPHGPSIKIFTIEVPEALLKTTGTLETIGELKKHLDGLPDDAPIMVDDGGDTYPILVNSVRLWDENNKHPQSPYAIFVDGSV